MADYREIPYYFGVNTCWMTMKRGVVVHAANNTTTAEETRVKKIKSCSGRSRRRASVEEHFYGVLLAEFVFAVPLSFSGRSASAFIESAYSSVLWIVAIVFSVGK